MPRAKESARGTVGDGKAPAVPSLFVESPLQSEAGAGLDTVLDQITEGLPEEALEHIFLADDAIEQGAWDRALAHYNAAALTLEGNHQTTGAPEANAVGRLFLNRGILRFYLAQRSLGLTSPAIDKPVVAGEDTVQEPTTTLEHAPVVEGAEAAPAAPVDPANIAEAARPRLRLPRVLGRGSQEQDEPSLSGGVGVIMLAEVNLGEREYAAKNWEGAIQHFDVALSFLGDRPSPEWSHARGLARVYFKRGAARFRLAQEDLDFARRAGETAENDDLAIKDVHSSLRDFSEAIHFDPDWSSSYSRRGEAHLFLARCHLAAKRPKEASKELKSALVDLTSAAERDPTAATGFVLRAIVYALLDHEEESEADVERAVSLGARAGTLRSAIRGAKSWRE